MCILRLDALISHNQLKNETGRNVYRVCDGMHLLIKIYSSFVGIASKSYFYLIVSNNIKQCLNNS